MVDIETIRCMSMLETLSAVSVKGFVPFSKYAEQTEDEDLPVIYDDSNEQELEGDRIYPVVLDADTDEKGELFITQDYDHYIDADGKAAIVRAVLPADKEQAPYIFVKLFGKDERSTIIVEDGAWYFDEEC